MPLWKRAALGLSIVLMLVGLGAQAVGYFQGGGGSSGAGAAGRTAGHGDDSEAAPPADSRGPAPQGRNGFLPSDREPFDPAPPTGPSAPSPSPGAGERPPELPGDAGTSAGADTTDAEGPGEWSPLVFKFGFSFFVGFCLGYLLRLFFKLTVAVIGLICLALFGLEYLGLVDIDWASMQPGYESALAWLKSETAGFRRFISGQLPAASLAALGLLAGFRKR